MSNRPGRKMSRRQQASGRHRPRSQTSRWTPKRIAAVACAVLLVVLLVAAIAAVVVNTDSDSGPPVNLAISLDEYSITGDLRSEPGNIVLDISNDGGSVHNVVLRGTARSRDLPPGDTQQLELGSLSPGTYQLICDIPGHAQLGMVATLSVG